MMKADLHLHSRFSDGLLSPEKLCLAAAKAGVTHLSLTDHDTAGGEEAMRAAAAENGLTYLPGAEISSGSGGHTHILIYGRVGDARVTAFLRDTGGGRGKRAKEILTLLLEKEGIQLPPEALERLQQPNVGRAHIARELIAAGTVNTMKQAFDRYLEKGASCYVPRELLSVTDTVKAVGGFPVVPVLAHPMEMGLDMPGTLALIESLIPLGLKGVEAFHPSASVQQGRMLEHFAREYGLLVTGGSDYHGDAASRATIGHTGHTWSRMEEDTEALFSACGAL